MNVHLPDFPAKTWQILYSEIYVIRFNFVILNRTNQRILEIFSWYLEVRFCWIFFGIHNWKIVYSAEERGRSPRGGSPACGSNWNGQQEDTACSFKTADLPLFPALRPIVGTLMHGTRAEGSSVTDSYLVCNPPPPPFTHCNNGFLASNYDTGVLISTSPPTAHFSPCIFSFSVYKLNNF